MYWLDDLKLLFQARVAVVNVVGPDEGDALRDLVALARSRDWPAGQGLYTWDIGDQFVCLHEPRERFSQSSATPDTVLKHIDDYQGSATFILKDFHQVWEAKRSLIRVLRNLAARLPGRRQPVNVILLTPEPCLPVELRLEVPVLEPQKPDARLLEELLAREGQNSLALQGVSPSLCARLVEAALGLSGSQAARAFRKAAVAAAGPFDERSVDLILDEKRRIIRQSGALELYPQAGGLSDVGGLQELTKWLDLRRCAFGAEAREYGLDMPKGVALIGIPGTGKSLCAKVTAGLWRMPLLRLDMGAVFGGVLGASERNLREAMAIAEVIAPCVLWVDEVEKAFAGGAGDSGTAWRVLATFLTWMQEKTSPVFVFATANNLRRLPPEFLRKGRFDEVFFLDLPTRAEREKILEVHLRRRDFTMIRQNFDLGRVAEATEGFVGAELEALVVAGMFPAFVDGRRAMETDDLLAAAEDMVPLARSHEKDVGELRALVESGQARNASAATVPQQVALDQIRGARRGRRVEV